MFDRVWINIRVAAYAARDINELGTTFLQRSFAHIVDPVPQTRNCRHEGCAAEKVRSHLGF